MGGDWQSGSRCVAQGRSLSGRARGRARVQVFHQQGSIQARTWCVRRAWWLINVRFLFPPSCGAWRGMARHVPRIGRGRQVCLGIAGVGSHDHWAWGSLFCCATLNCMFRMSLTSNECCNDSTDGRSLHNCWHVIADIITVDAHGGAGAAPRVCHADRGVAAHLSSGWAAAPTIGGRAERGQWWTALRFGSAIHRGVPSRAPVEQSGWG